jgi:hypothetical protein
MFRLRRRLDRMEDQLTRTAEKARGTMSEADRTMLMLQQEVFGTIKDFILDVQDGVGVSIERSPDSDGTLVDFAMGKVDKVPIRIMIDISADTND